VIPPRFGALPGWAEWLAQDADGTWWAYEACPNRHDSGWYENELGRCVRLGQDSPNPDWTRRLLRIEAP
jgi:hypothetical protein